MGSPPQIPVANLDRKERVRSRSNLRQLLTRRYSAAEIFGERQEHGGGGGEHASQWTWTLLLRCSIHFLGLASTVAGALMWQGAREGGRGKGEVEGRGPAASSSRVLKKAVSLDSAFCRSSSSAQSASAGVPAVQRKGPGSPYPRLALSRGSRKVVLGNLWWACMALLLLSAAFVLRDTSSDKGSLFEYNTNHGLVDEVSSDESTIGLGEAAGRAGPGDVKASSFSIQTRERLHRKLYEVEDWMGLTSPWLSAPSRKLQAPALTAPGAALSLLQRWLALASSSLALGARWGSPPDFLAETASKAGHGAGGSTGWKSSQDVWAERAGEAGHGAGDGTVWPSAVPGSKIESPEQAAALRTGLGCVASKGRWALDSTPRLLPWPVNRALFGHCDERHVADPGGGVAYGKADAVAKKGAQGASKWNVRPGLKYTWQFEPQTCPAQAHEMRDKGGSEMHSFRRDEVCRILLGAGSGHSDFSDTKVSPGQRRRERVMLLVGDSVQNEFASSILNNILVGVPASQRAGLAQLIASKELPCHEEKLKHRQVCWGADLCHGTGLGSLRMVFVRNDFLSVVKQARWSRNGKNFELAWLPLLKTLIKEQHWIETQQGGQPQQKARKHPRRFQMLHPQLQQLPPIVVLNRGLHYVDDGRFFPQLQRSLSAARHACPQCLLLLRNSAGGHKSCNNARVPLLKKPPTSYPPFNWKEIGEQSQNPMMAKMVEDVGGIFLDVETMTSMRPDGHTGRNRKGTEDCTHYCAPGPVDHWTRLLFHSLHLLV